MGCDIHFYVEKWTNVPNLCCPRLKDNSQIREEQLSKILDNKPNVWKWESIDSWFFDKQNDYWEHDSIFLDRNYRLFSFLSDVRNDGSIEPLDEPRGIPKDASDSYLWACNSWAGSAHSHSWFLLDELLRVDLQKWYKLNAKNFIENLQMLEGDPNEIRICFFFDN